MAFLLKDFQEPEISSLTHCVSFTEAEQYHSSAVLSFELLGENRVTYFLMYQQTIEGQKKKYCKHVFLLRLTVSPH